MKNQGLGFIGTNFTVEKKSLESFSKGLPLLAVQRKIVAYKKS